MTDLATPLTLVPPVPVDTATIHATIRGGAHTIRAWLATLPHLAPTARAAFAGDPFAPEFRQALDTVAGDFQSWDVALTLAWALDAARDHDLPTATKWIYAGVATIGADLAEQDHASQLIEAELTRRQAQLAATDTARPGGARFVWVVGDALATGTVRDLAESSRHARRAGTTVGPVYHLHRGAVVECQVSVAPVAAGDDDGAFSAVTISCPPANLFLNATLRAGAAH